MGFANRLKLGFSRIFAGQQGQFSQRVGNPKQANSISLSEIQAFNSPGFSQPVWGPEISMVGNYSREGYTSKTFDTPVVPHSTQVYFVERDEDIQHGLHRLSSLITGGQHYWKSEIEQIQDTMTQFSKDIDFDWLDNIMIKELLAYGNSVWKARLGISQIRNRDDIMHIPISSFVRIWWDRNRVPYKFEFRGSEYQGYHNAEDIIHLSWNPINASAFGTGFMAALVASKDFEDLTPTGTVQKKLPSLMDRKYSMAMLTHLSARRYSPHNVYVAADASADERLQLSSDLADLDTGEDIVVGNKVEVQELGTNARAYDPSQFMDTVMGQIFKALNDFSGKQGSESSHQYANAETSAALDELGLASFPLAITKQLQEKLFQPWYEMNGGIIVPEYGGGIVSVPWKEANPELNFGRIQKRDVPAEESMKMLEIGIQSGAIQDPVEIRQLLEDAGLGLRHEFTQSLSNEYNNTSVYPPGMQQQNFDTHNQDVAQRPYDDPGFSSSNRDFDIKSSDATWQGNNAAQNPQPSDPRLNFTANRSVSGNLPDELMPDDANEWLANTGNNSETLDEEERKIKLEKERLKNEQRRQIVEALRKL